MRSFPEHFSVRNLNGGCCGMILLSFVILLFLAHVETEGDSQRSEVYTQSYNTEIHTPSRCKSFY